jgi:hypothetical protein
MNEPDKGVSLLMATRSLLAVRNDIWPALASNRTLKQIVVAVDAPRDEASSGRADELAAQFPQWRWDVLFCGKVGMAAALNQGLKAVRFPLIARHDDDDVSLPGRIDHEVDEMVRDPRLVAVGSHLQYIRDGRLRVRRYPLSDAAIRAAMTVHNSLAHPSVLVKTDVLREVSFRDEFAYSEDYEGWVRLLRLGQVKNLDEPLVEYAVKNKVALRRFDHRGVCLGNVRLKWRYRKDLVKKPAQAAPFLVGIMFEVLLAVTPRFFYSWVYRWFIYP